MTKEAARDLKYGSYFGPIIYTLLYQLGLTNNDPMVTEDWQSETITVRCTATSQFELECGSTRVMATLKHFGENASFSACIKIVHTDQSSDTGLQMILTIQGVAFPDQPKI